jgi:predicted nuclease of predicted toxin-antitoxin system
MAYAVQTGSVVFTHDLDIGAILASTSGSQPSVLQLRSQDVSPESMGAPVLAALRQFSAELAAGALVTIDPTRSRVRLLPLTPGA